MQKTGIEYLDYTWNPIAMRCTPVSPGCERCWHLRTANRLKNNTCLPEAERRALSGYGSILRGRELDAPMKVKKPSVIGVQFMGDLYHETVSNSQRDFVYEGMNAAPWHTYLILTKRPDAMLADFNRAGGGTIPDYIRPGLTVCNQAEADEKIPIFLQVPGKKFLSIEPMLGEIDLNSVRGMFYPFPNGWTKINAVILGGESGPGARPMHPDWVRSVRDQCAAAGVPFFFKSWGKIEPSLYDTIGKTFPRPFDVFTKNLHRHLDGRTHDELPWVKAAP